MTTPTQPMPEAEAAVRAEIAGFVVAVEQELGDLPAEDVADLVGGLEADLTEAWAAEGTTPTQRFGSPAAYAAELRASAGLPARKPPTGSGFSPWARVSRWFDDVLAGLRSQPGWPVVAERGRQLRPAWWALRAGLLAVAVSVFLGAFVGVISLNGIALISIVLAVPAVLLSMSWGAADRIVDRRTRRLATAWNLAAVLALGWLLVLASSAASSSSGGGYAEPETIPGLSMDGEAVSNVFAYDAQGNPLTGVRLYDQNGRPLTVGDQGRMRYDDYDNERDVRPSLTDQGPAQWNLYPLQERSLPSGGTATPYTDPKPPYERVAPLPADTEEPRPSPSPSPSRASTGSTSSTKP